MPRPSRQGGLRASDRGEGLRAMRLPGPAEGPGARRAGPVLVGPSPENGPRAVGRDGVGPFLLDSNTHEATRARIGYCAESGRQAPVIRPGHLRSLSVLA